MKNLQKLAQILERKQTDSIFNYTVPDIWNCFDYPLDESVITPWGEIIVNPYKFYHYVVTKFILPQADSDGYEKPLSRKNKITKAKISEMNGYRGGDWIRNSVVYSTMIRTSTSWDHDRSGTLDESNIYSLKDFGTFVKSLALLPTLRKMGVDTVYMLPISRFSIKDKKGDLGSPYGVSNFFELDPGLKDSITGEEMTLEEEFKAFVEACHILGMRVVIDIIPRTNSVNSDFIIEHPEWFYWIRYSDLNSYYPPSVPGLGPTLTPKHEFMKQVYKSKQVWDHIQKFVENPKSSDPEKWKVLVERWKGSNEHIIDLVREMFGLTIAPAFSDHINDTQPPWTDVTYFRMFLDNPRYTSHFTSLRPDLAPYILFDTIKNNLYPGDVPNMELWEVLSDIVPYYQKNFGIDGARIDMGHALASDLIKMIVDKARKNDPDFCFIAEELYPEKAYEAMKQGYNMIIGQGFYMQPRIWEFKAHEYYYSSKDLPVPVFAGGETHDTPRLAARDGGRTLSKMVTILNMFMPNGVPFINSGQEVWETQPMNTGLDCATDEAYRLDPMDPYNGKLALFDKFALHYTNSNRWDLIDTLETISAIRRQYITTLTSKDNFVGLGFESMRTQAIGMGYIIEERKEDKLENCLIIVANTNVHSEQHLMVDISHLRNAADNFSRNATLIYSQYEWSRNLHDFDHNNNLHLHMRPGEVKIILL